MASQFWYQAYNGLLNFNFQTVSNVKQFQFFETVGTKIVELIALIRGLYRYLPANNLSLKE